MRGWWRAFRQKNPGASVGRILFWEFVRCSTFLFTFAFYRLRGYYSHRIPATGPVLLLTNHQSYLDLLVLGPTIPHRHFHSMARLTLFDSKLFGAWIRGLNAFPVDQTKGDIRAIRTAIERLNAGQLVLIFPEGSRTPDGAMREFQEGVLLILRRAKPTVVCGAIEGAFDAWPIRRKRPRLRARAAILYGEPIPAEKLLALKKDEILPHLARVIDGLRLELREKIRLQTGGEFPKPGPGDQPYQPDA